jgi:hypothetical protein
MRRCTQWALQCNGIISNHCSAQQLGHPQSPELPPMTARIPLPPAKEKVGSSAVCACGEKEGGREALWSGGVDFGAC